MSTSTRHYSMHLAWSEEDDAWVASSPELPGCMGDGPNPFAAIDNLEDAMEEWLSAQAAAGNPIPEPRVFSLPSQLGEVGE